MGIFSSSKNTTVTNNTVNLQTDVTTDVDVQVTNAPEIFNQVEVDMQPVAASLDKLSASLSANAATSAAAIVTAADTLAGTAKAATDAASEAADGIVGTLKEWGGTASALLALIGLAVFIWKGTDVKVTL